VRAILVAAGVLVALSAAPPRALAQGAASPKDEDHEQGFVEMLRREDPAGAERSVTLRDARARAITELERAQARYRAAGSELRVLVRPQLRQAQRAYAEASLALVDFLDARDRQALARYQAEVGRINDVIGDRARARAELEKMLKE
jgi:hypothetical protein